MIDKINQFNNLLINNHKIAIFITITLPEIVTINIIAVAILIPIV